VKEENIFQKPVFDWSLETKSPEKQTQLKKSSLKFRVLIHLF